MKLKSTQKFAMHTIYNLGLVLQEQGKYLEAEKCFLLEVEKNQDQESSYYSLEILMQEQNRIKEAEKYYKKTIEKDKEFKAAYYNLGLLLQEQNRFQEAELYFKKLLGIDPASEEVYFSLGKICQDQKNRLGEAEAFFKKVIELDLRHEKAYVELSHLYQNQNRLTEQENCICRLTEINLNDKNMYKLGVVLQKHHKLEEAVMFFRKAIELNSNNEDAKEKISLIFREINSKDDIRNSLLNKNNNKTVNQEEDFNIYNNDDFSNRILLKKIDY